MADEGFYLGGMVDVDSGDRTEELTHYDPADLTTHGVIVGMTGSGKTGLGIIYLEEALLAGIPTLILDPKGDMTNLLLTFPELRPADFEPWIDEGQARKEDKSVAELAAATADLWRNGLASWDQDGARIGALRAAAGFTIYTPGSAAGVPLNIVGSLQAPSGSFDDEAEALRDEIEGFVSGLLGLVGIEADPISSREHILLANLVEHAWREGQNLDIADLLLRIQQPPMRKLGVFEVDTFFPEKDRMALAMKLNGLIASPSFAAWLAGPPLDVGRLLYDEAGAPQASILYLAHLSEEERQFIVTLVLSKVVTWMRQQSGTGDLRAMVYMDEVFGFVPPTAQPPAKKPILTLLKQARAFGVGLLLSTQNPVDLDYKAMSNAGTWCVGRLQTERDKARILEALQSARGDSDTATLDKLISGLGKRRFLLHNTHEKEPALFTTRWAMSYLRGPLTKAQIEELMADHRARRASEQAAAAPATAAQAETAPTPAAAAAAPPATAAAPAVAPGVPVYYLDPAAPWAAEVGATAGGTRLEPALAARVRVLYDEAHADLRHEEEWEAVFHPLVGPVDPAAGRPVDYEPRDFRAQPPPGAAYAEPQVNLEAKSFFSGAGSALKDHLYRTRSIEIYKNPKLKLYSRVGETREEFLQRCRDHAEDEADREVAKIRERFEGRLDRVRDEIQAAAARADELRADVTNKRQGELLEGVGSLLGSLFGGRKSTRAISSAGRRRSTTRSAESRLRTAETKLADKVEDLEELEMDLLEEVTEINDRWQDRAGEVEVVEVRLEKDDISVEEVAVVWVPTSQAG